MRTPPAERSTPRIGLLVVLVLVGLALTTLWFREGAGGPLHRIQVAMQGVTAPIGRVGELATTPVRSAGRWTSNFIASRSEIATLRQQNATLRARVAELEEARIENARLRGLIAMTQRGKIKALGAGVIGRPTGTWEGFITIDKGKADGVESGMAVTGVSGLLGRTTDVTSHTSRVQLITDQRSGVAAIVQSTRAGGIVKGSIEGDLSLNYVSRETTVRPGDVVVTSGIGGVYPKGLLIGDVTKARKDPGELYQRIEVRPTAQIAGIEEVLVLLSKPPAPELGVGE
jgi:rod shape-determining protein MreC